MREEVKEFMINWINRTALLFTSITLCFLLINQSINKTSTFVIFIFCALTSMSDRIVFRIPKIKRWMKYILHFIFCAFIYLIVISIGFHFNPFIHWSLQDWIIILSSSALLYWGLSTFYWIQWKQEEKELNNRLEMFKKEYK